MLIIIGDCIYRKIIYVVVCCSIVVFFAVVDFNSHPYVILLAVLRNKCNCINLIHNICNLKHFTNDANCDNNALLCKYFLYLLYKCLLGVHKICSHYMMLPMNSQKQLYSIHSVQKFAVRCNSP